MRELMAAPIVPGTETSDWTIIHTDDEPLWGSRVHYAFTNRDALERWAASVERWPTTRKDGSRLLLLSEVPNSAILVLDEAWSLKYVDPAPEMRSAEDGRRVLEMLLRGRATDAQRQLHGHEYFLVKSLKNTNIDGASLLYKLLLLRDCRAKYVTLDPKNWKANGEVTADGELVVQTPRENYHVTSPEEIVAGGNGSHLTWLYEYVGPVMVVECWSIYGSRQWAPRPSEMEPPLYLGLLA